MHFQLWYFQLKMGLSGCDLIINQGVSVFKGNEFLKKETDPAHSPGSTRDDIMAAKDKIQLGMHRMSRKLPDGSLQP
jgi:hypothetical protein